MKPEGHDGAGGIALIPTLLLVLLLVPVAGRALLACLPPGRIGSHRASDLAETLFVSTLLGVWITALGDLGLAGDWTPWIVFGGLAVAALGRLALRPHALVPQHELPRPRWGWNERALAGVLAVATLWPLDELLQPGEWDVLERLIQAALVVMATSHLVRSVECAGRATRLGLVLALVTLTPQVTPNVSEFAEVLMVRLLTLTTATSLVGWLRRADERDRALALISSGVLAGFDVRLAGAGLLATVLATHANALKSTVKAELAAFTFVALPLFALVWLEGTPRSPDWPSAPGGSLGGLTWPLALVVTLVLASVFVGTRAARDTTPGRFAPAGREVGAIALFCGLPIALAALERSVPGLELEFAPLSPQDLGLALVPAAAFLATITLAPQRKP